MNLRRHSVACAVCLSVAIALMATPTHAQRADSARASALSTVQPQRADSAAARAAVHAAPADSGRMPVMLLDEGVLIGRGTAHLLTAPLRWRGAELRTIGTAAVSLVALSSLDEAGRAFMLRNESVSADQLATEIERLGTVQNFAVLGTFLIAGVAFDDAKARGVAAEGLVSSLIAGGVITPTLQRIVGRSRPRKEKAAHSFAPMSGSLSFPSGHTTQAFAVASVIATEYDHPAVQVVAYGLASAVAASRMYHRAHFLSDVTAAALIGTVVGRSVAHYGQRSRGETVRLQPILETDAFGVAVTIAR